MPARILLVEDNPANMKLMSYLLKAAGHELTTATDGVQALQMVQSNDYDLIVCDVQMPKLDGCALARKLKSDPRLRTVPLVAVTALAMVGDEDKMLAAGFDGYLAKPIMPQNFVAQVEAFLQPAMQTPRRAQVPAASGPPSPPKIVPPSAGKRRSVLVVDNSPVNIDLIRKTLEPAGFQVESASNGREGLILARQMTLSLILCDLHMPGMSGFDFIRAVKADSQLRSIPFVFISASTWEEKDRTDGLALGADKFLVRPMESQAFVAEIEACLVALKPSSRP